MMKSLRLLPGLLVLLLWGCGSDGGSGNVPSTPVLPGTPSTTGSVPSTTGSVPSTTGSVATITVPGVAPLPGTGNLLVRANFPGGAPAGYTAKIAGTGLSALLGTNSSFRFNNVPAGPQIVEIFVTAEGPAGPVLDAVKPVTVQAGLTYSPPVVSLEIETAQGGQTGIQGIVVEGPVTAAPPVGDPDVKPFGGGPINIFDGIIGGGALVATVTPAADGTFSVNLPPGDYQAVPANATGGFPHANPTSFSVSIGLVSFVVIQYDTGLEYPTPPPGTGTLLYSQGLGCGTTTFTVMVKGTNLSAPINCDGKVLLTGVPAGIQTLLFIRTGDSTNPASTLVAAENLTVTPGGTTFVPVPHFPGGGYENLQGGISGLVTEGPITPVSRPGDPNVQPFAGATLNIFRHGDTTGMPVATVVSGADGNFSVDLPDGTYDLVPVNGPNGLPRAAPQTFQVNSGFRGTLLVQYDTGIR